MFNASSFARPGGGGGLMGLVRRLVVLVFAVIQAVLVARILFDLGIIPADWTLVVDNIVPISDALAAPVAALGDGIGGIFGGGVPGIGPMAGDGLNAAMIAALVGWTIVEGLVLGVVRKFASV